MNGPKSNAEWEVWGSTDPLYGVASWDGKGKDGNRPWTREEFLAQGEADWWEFLRHWEGYDVELKEPNHVLEIGCGAGRLTWPMTSHFAQVVGVDISASMIEEARKVGEFYATGADPDFRIGDGAVLPAIGDSFDGVFSTHVFQHLETKADALTLWTEAYRVLKPGGTAMVHLPIRIWPAGLERLEWVYALKRKLGDVKAARARQKMILNGGPPIMRGQSYDWDELEADLRFIGFVDVRLSIFRLASDGGMHHVVFARKPVSTAKLVGLRPEASPG